MGHQPFEIWLLNEQKLTESQSQELAAHMVTCSECQELRRSLTPTIVLLASPPIAVPNPGFTDRWKVNLAERRALQHKHQTRLFFLSTILGAIAALGGLITMLSLANISVPDLFVSGAKLLAGLFNLAGDVRFYLGSSLSGPLPVILWILVSVGFCLLIFAWIYMLWRISLQGVPRDEKSN
jgi:hypothetical protein